MKRTAIICALVLLPFAAQAQQCIPVCITCIAPPQPTCQKQAPKPHKPKPVAKRAAPTASAPSTCRADPVADLQARQWIPKRDRDEIAAMIRSGKPGGEFRVSSAGVVDLAADPGKIVALSHYTMATGHVARGGVDMSLWLEPMFGTYWSAGVTTYAVVGPCWRGVELARVAPPSYTADLTPQDRRANAILGSLGIAPKPRAALAGTVSEPGTAWIVGLALLGIALLGNHHRKDGK